jgi:dTDP-4-dehydrorhamnose 3,5-epimerase
MEVSLGLRMINLPTCPYDHADPDKYRLPIKNELIPFDFDDGPGW